MARAEGGQSSSNSAAQQYIQAIPTATGSRQSPPAQPRKTSAISPSLNRTITRHGGTDASALRAITADATLGAPAAAAHPKPATRGGSKSRPAPRAAAPQTRGGGANPIAAAFDVGHGVPVVALLCALLLLGIVNLIGARRASARASHAGPHRTSA